jgi:serine/threonine protein phosphatase PrpC
VSSLIKKLTGKSSSTAKTQPAASISPDTEPAPRDQKPAPQPLIRRLVGVAQSVGQQRDHNEDALFTLTSDIQYNDQVRNFGFYVVADGMGGHLSGEVASQIAIQTMAGWVTRELYISTLTMDVEPPPEEISRILAEGLQQANQAVKEKVPGGGTTLTALLLLGSDAHVVHVGDSRVYWVEPDGTSQVLTHDHSFVNQLVELGQITPEQAAHHPQRNVLYQAVGQVEPLEPQVVIYPLPTSGNLLLCSDGLWGVIHDEKIIEIINSTSFPQDACQKMIDAANQAGGPDNITAVLVRLPG